MNNESGRRKVIVVGVAAALAGLAWWWLPGAEPERPQPAEVAATPSGPAAYGQLSPPPAGPASTAATGTAGLSADRLPAPWDLCGVGRVARPVGAGDGGATLAELPDPIGRLALQESGERLRQALGAGDARQRVAAQLWHPPEGDDEAARRTWAAGLLAAAHASSDAQALRWASAACAYVDDTPRCRTDLARARVRAEPANALHWLDWAHEEPAAADAAWAGLVTAQYWHEQPLALAVATQRALDVSAADVPGYLRSAIAVEALGRDAALPLPPATPIEQRCTDVAPGSARQAECHHVAHLLVERSDSASALSTGRQIGELMGWPEAKLQQLGDDLRSLHAQPMRWTLDPRQPHACDSVAGQLAHIAAVGREGETSALRAAGAHDGR